MYTGIKDWPTLVNDFNVKNNSDILSDVVINNFNPLKPNAINKQIVLKLGMNCIIKKLQYETYKNDKNCNDNEENEKIRNSYRDNQKSLILLFESYRINNSYYKRLQRLRDRVKRIIISNGVKLFLTFTFTDKALESTNEQTRRRYVSRFLKDNCIDYVANVDYGAKNGREHYHAIVSCHNKIDYTIWPYGTINGQRIRIEEKNCCTKLSKYITKLSNHAIKETTKRSHLVYSRHTNIDNYSLLN